MKIFYSWQEDKDQTTCKTLIREALENAAKNVSDEVAIDHDTKRVLGSPNIVDVIARKIRDSSVFVADVTLTGETLKPDNTKKKQINSNVAVELGYALGIHGDSVIVKVMNEYYGVKDELPFDIRDRFPVRFTLAPNSDKKKRKSIRSQLVSELESIFEEHYKEWQSDKTSPQPVVKLGWQDEAVLKRTNRASEKIDALISSAQKKVNCIQNNGDTFFLDDRDLEVAREVLKKETDSYVEVLEALKNDRSQTICLNRGGLKPLKFRLENAGEQSANSLTVRVKLPDWLFATRKIPTTSGLPIAPELRNPEYQYGTYIRTPIVKDAVAPDISEPLQQIELEVDSLPHKRSSDFAIQYYFLAADHAPAGSQILKYQYISNELTDWRTGELVIHISE